MLLKNVPVFEKLTLTKIWAFNLHSTAYFHLHIYPVILKTILIYICFCPKSDSKYLNIKSQILYCYKVILSIFCWIASSYIQTFLFLGHHWKPFLRHRVSETRIVNASSFSISLDVGQLHV